MAGDYVSIITLGLTEVAEYEGVISAPFFYFTTSVGRFFSIPCTKRLNSLYIGLQLLLLINESNIREPFEKFIDSPYYS
jgi:hypothetical protein